MYMILSVVNKMSHKKLERIPMSTAQVGQILSKRLPGQANLGIVRGGQVTWGLPGGTLPLAIYLIFPTPNSPVGHYVATMRHQPGHICFFDPYGESDTIQFIRPLFPANTKFHANPFAMETRKKDINTCGDWCILRLEFSHLDDSEFARRFYGTSDHQAATQVFDQLDPNDLDNDQPAEAAMAEGEGGGVDSEAKEGDTGSSNPLKNPHTETISQYLAAARDSSLE